jgi:hypothetical protein
LVGGTAIAVHLGHRQSRDLDFFLAQQSDLGVLRARLEARDDFATTRFEEGTLNGNLGGAKVQFLQATNQTILVPMAEVAGIEVAALEDLLAMKLKVISDRGELRDYFDIMEIERRTTLTVEEGLGLLLDRYHPANPIETLSRTIRTLGFLGDVLDDPGLPVARQEVEKYWHRRQPAIVAAMDIDGEVVLTPPPVPTIDQGSRSKGPSSA